MILKKNMVHVLGSQLEILKKVEDPGAFKTMTKEWIWENIPSY